MTASPFVPFVIRVTGGRVFTVRHPENAACDPAGRALVVLDQDGIHQAEMLLVEVMEPISAAGNRERGRRPKKK